MKTEIITLSFDKPIYTTNNPFLKVNENVKANKLEKERAEAINEAVQKKHVEIIDEMLNNINGKLIRSGLNIEIESRNNYGYNTDLRRYGNESLMATTVYTNRGFFDIGIQSQKIEEGKYPIYSTEYELYILSRGGKEPAKSMKDFKTFEKVFSDTIQKMLI